MKVVQTTEAAADALCVIVNKAYGFPRAGTPGPTLVARAIQSTWDGTGPTPFGWTKTQVQVFRVSAADAWVGLDDATLAATQVGAISGAELATLNAAATVRPDVDDPTQGGTRPPKN